MSLIGAAAAIGGGRLPPPSPADDERAPICFTRCAKIAGKLITGTALAVPPDSDRFAALVSGDIVYVVSVPALVDSAPDATPSDTRWLLGLLHREDVGDAWIASGRLEVIRTETRKTVRRLAQKNTTFSALPFVDLEPTPASLTIHEATRSKKRAMPTAAIAAETAYEFLAPEEGMKGRPRRSTARRRISVDESADVAATNKRRRRRPTVAEEDTDFEEYSEEEEEEDEEYGLPPAVKVPKTEPSSTPSKGRRRGDMMPVLTGELEEFTSPLGPRPRKDAAGIKAFPDFLPKTQVVDILCGAQSRRFHRVVIGPRLQSGYEWPLLVISDCGDIVLTLVDPIHIPDAKPSRIPIEHLVSDLFLELTENYPENKVFFCSNAQPTQTAPVPRGRGRGRGRKSQSSAAPSSAGQDPAIASGSLVRFLGWEHKCYRPPAAFLNRPPDVDGSIWFVVCLVDILVVFRYLARRQLVAEAVIRLPQLNPHPSVDNWTHCVSDLLFISLAGQPVIFAGTSKGLLVQVDLRLVPGSVEPLQIPVEVLSSQDTSVPPFPGMLPVGEVPDAEAPVVELTARQVLLASPSSGVLAANIPLCHDAGRGVRLIFLKGSSLYVMSVAAHGTKLTQVIRHPSPFGMPVCNIITNLAPDGRLRVVAADAGGSIYQTVLDEAPIWQKIPDRTTAATLPWIQCWRELKTTDTLTLEQLATMPASQRANAKTGKVGALVQLGPGFLSCSHAHQMFSDINFALNPSNPIIDLLLHLAACWNSPEAAASPIPETEESGNLSGSLSADLQPRFRSGLEPATYWLESLRLACRGRRQQRPVLPDVVARPKAMLMNQQSGIPGMTSAEFTRGCKLQHIERAMRQMLGENFAAAGPLGPAPGSGNAAGHPLSDFESLCVSHWVRVMQTMPVAGWTAAELEKLGVALCTLLSMANSLVDKLAMMPAAVAGVLQLALPVLVSTMNVGLAEGPQGDPAGIAKAFALTQLLFVLYGLTSNKQNEADSDATVARSGVAGLVPVRPPGDLERLLLTIHSKVTSLLFLRSAPRGGRRDPAVSKALDLPAKFAEGEELLSAHMQPFLVALAAGTSFTQATQDFEFSRDLGTLYADDNERQEGFFACRHCQTTIILGGREIFPWLSRLTSNYCRCCFCYAELDVFG